jgi:hypothetical protein
MDAGTGLLVSGCEKRLRLYLQQLLFVLFNSLLIKIEIKM